MSILDLLDDRSDVPLITSCSIQFTKSDFIDLVYFYVDSLKDISFGNRYVLITEERPVEFFGLVFALWKIGCHVLFPNRDILKNKACFPYFGHSVFIHNGNPKCKVNKSFKTISGLEKIINGDAVVFTSGSTGEPKGIIHNKENFLINAQGVVELLNDLKGTSITFLKPYLVSAFSHFLVHFLKDAHLLFNDMDQISELPKYYNDNQNISIVGSPMQIILARKYIPDYAKPCVFMSSGDFIYPSIIRNLLYSFPNAIFYSVYGLAELGGRFFINRINSNSDFLQYMCLGNKLSGMDYKIIANELHVRSNSQFSAYIKNDSLVYANEYHSTGDLILSNSGCLTLAGRHNDEIKIAGNKISLKTLEQKASIVFPDDIVLFIPVKHDTLGTLIAIVISSDRIYERKEVILSLRKVLEIYEIPHYIYMIHKIPYTQTMKIDRKWISKNISSLQAI